MNTRAPRTALLMAYNKTDDFLDFASALSVLGWTLLGSEGTAKFLNKNNVECKDIADYVGEPILGHQVVSISREIAAALLSDNSEASLVELKRIGMPRIDLVYVDLYPLEKEIDNPNATLESVRKNTDIGGVTILRAAAKGLRIVLCEEKQFIFCLKVIRGNLTPAHMSYEEFLIALAAYVENYVSGYSAVAAKLLREYAATINWDE